MDRFEAEYRAALVSVEDSISRIIEEPALLSGDVAVDVERIESNLDGWDYCYAVAIGLAGVLISTNEEFGRYLDQIHKAASGTSGAAVLCAAPSQRSGFPPSQTRYR